MRGNDKVHKDLSEALKAELTAINQYFLHGKMCDNWGYFRLGAHYRKESIEEMVHAEKLMDRILFSRRNSQHDRHREDQHRQQRQGAV